MLICDTAFGLSCRPRFQVVCEAKRLKSRPDGEIRQIAGRGRAKLVASNGGATQPLLLSTAIAWTWQVYIFSFAACNFLEWFFFCYKCVLSIEISFATSSYPISLSLRMTTPHTINSLSNNGAAMSRPLDTEFSINGLGLTANSYPRRRISPEPESRPNADFVGARSAWASRPQGHAMDRIASRSRSPVPADRQNFVPRSRTPSNPSRPPPVSRYHYIPREYHSPPKLTLDIPRTYRPVPLPVRPLPPSRNISHSPRARSDPGESRLGAGPVSQHSSELLPRNRPGGQTVAMVPLVPKPLNVRGQAARPLRKRDSMVEYLSLEQLENLWQSQDMYVGTVIAPQQPANPPMFRIPEGPRSPITSIHPAFRNDPQNDPNYASVTCA